MNQRPARQLCSTPAAIWLLLLLVLAVNFAIRWRLRDLPLERDEGEYAYAGQLLLQGIPPYQLAWNMKFPGVYFAYAGLLAVFGESAAGIHCGLIFVTSLSTLLVFLIGRKLLNPLGGLMAAAFFTWLSALPFAYGLAGHATHFVVLCVCLGMFGLLRKEKSQPLFWLGLAGVAFGLAILMKQHAVVFALAAAAWLGWQMFRNKIKSFLPGAVFLAGVAAPLLLTFALLAWAGVWERFNFWTMQYARQYVSIFPLAAAPTQFVAGFGPVFNDGVWIWLLGSAGLGLLFTAYRPMVKVSAGWLFAGLVAACPGFYFRGHYFLMAMPALALLNAALLLALADWLEKFPQIRMLKILPAVLFCLVTGDLLVRNAGIWFQLTPLEVSRRLYQFNPFPESPVIARYLAAHTQPDDTIAVLGSEPQLFFLAHRHSASGYLYVYPLTEPQPLAPVMRAEFKQEIENARPKYVVQVNALASWRTLILPGETDQILADFDQWWTAYATNYQLVGQVDLAEDQPTAFYWDEQLSVRTNPLPANLSIFRRK